MPESVPSLDTVPVQLARMEGTLDLIADRVSGLMTRVDRLDRDVGDLKSSTQSLSERMDSEATKAIALATALEKADEARRHNAATVWSPFAKTVTAVVAAVAVLTLVIQLYAAAKPG